MNFDLWRHSTRAWLFHFFGREAAAYRDYVQAFQHGPSAPAARAIAFIAARSERLEESCHWFEKALEIEPEDADTWFNLGFTRERKGARLESIQAFQEAVRLKPILDRAWYGMGLAQAKLGNHGEAATALEEAVRLQPMNGEAWYQLAMAHHHARNPVRVKEIIEHVRGFEPKRSNQLIHDTERSDLAHLVQELPF